VHIQISPRGSLVLALRTCEQLSSLVNLQVIKSLIIRSVVNYLADVLSDAPFLRALEIAMRTVFSLLRMSSLHVSSEKHHFRSGVITFGALNDKK